MSKVRVVAFLGDKQVSHVETHLTLDETIDWWDRLFANAVKCNELMPFPFDGKVALLNPHNVLCIMCEEIEEAEDE